jgi:prevent-host-death family protein
MTTMSFYEARTHLSELFDRVAQGSTVLITRHGRPAAMLVPAPPEEKKHVRQVIDEFKAYSKRQGRTLGNLSAREMIEEGRRN